MTPTTSPPTSPTARPGHWPAFAALPTVGDTDERTSWGVFGDDDELGTVNFLTPAAVSAAAATVTAGEVVTMALPLHEPDPPLAIGRETLQHHITRDRGGSDDRVDNFFPQGSTQWDGLGHVRFREFGYYGGRDDAALDDGALGVDVLARHGIIGRGVLVDWAGYRAEAQSGPLDVTVRECITPADLEVVLAWQGTTLEPGDVLLLRTGWLEWYRALDTAARADLAGSLHNGEGGLETPGLDPAPATAQWFWDHRIAAAAADTPTLARACARHGRHHFLLCASPLPLARGVGSPVNPQAVF